METETAKDISRHGLFKLVCIVVFVSGTFPSTCGLETVVIKCSENKTISAPSPHETFHLVLTTYAQDVNSKCFLTITPFNSTTLNHIFFSVSSDPVALTQISLYQIYAVGANDSLHLSNVSRTDDLDYVGESQMTHRVILQPATNVSQNISVGYLQSVMKGSECPESGKTLQVTSNKTVVKPLLSVVDRPYAFNCFYRINIPADSVLQVQISISNIQCKNDLDFIQIQRGGPYALCNRSMNSLFKIPYTSPNSVWIEFRSVYVDGPLPDFGFTYWIEPMCLAEGKVQAFPVNARELVMTFPKYPFTSEGHGNCYWRFNTFYGWVVRIDFFSSDIYCDQRHDRLILDSILSLDVCNNFSSSFVYWSNTSFLTMDYFQGADDGLTRAYSLRYSAEPRGVCQGRPIELVATKEKQNVMVKALSTDRVSRGTECQWLITTSDPGYKIKIFINSGLSSCDTSKIRFYKDGSKWTRFGGRGTLPCVRNVIGSMDLLYVVQSSKVLVVFTRDSKDYEHFQMTYQEYLDPSSTTTERGTSGSDGLMYTMHLTLFILLLWFYI